VIKLFPIIFLVFVVLAGYSQSASELIFKGNKFYREGDYKNAEASYRKSVEKNSQYDFQGRYNLANSLFMLKDYEGARNIYASLLQKNTDKAAQNKLYHNIGNTYLMEKKYQESIAAYKNALKNNPNDEDARYNLSYALKKLQQQQQNQNNKDQNKDQNKDKNQNKDNNKDQNKDDQNKDQQNKPDQQQNQKNELNQQQAEQMLKALQNKEKQTQREIHANPAQSGDEKKGTGAGYKDW